MQEYDKMSFRVEDVAVIRRYAASRNLKFVEAMHGIATILERVMREKRPVRTTDFSMPQDLPVNVSVENPSVRPGRQRMLFSTDRLGFRKLNKGT